MSRLPRAVPLGPSAEIPTGYPADVVDTAVEWLLASKEPAIRYRARTWLLGRRETHPAVRADGNGIQSGPIVATLVDLPQPRTHPYRKWAGVHWRLVSLADFELPVDALENRAILDEALVLTLHAHRILTAAGRV